MDRHYLYRRLNGTIGYNYWLEESRTSLENTEKYIITLGKIIKKWDAPKKVRDKIWDVLNKCEHQVDISLNNLEGRIKEILSSQKVKSSI